MNVNVLEYRIMEDEYNFNPLLHYTDVSPDEMLCRKYCDYFIRDGKVYEKYSNGLEGDRHTVYLKASDDEAVFTNASKYTNEVCVEIRDFKEDKESPLVYLYRCGNHYDALTYLISDHLVLLGSEWRKVSTELDDDRKVYVIYANAFNE